MKYLFLFTLSILSFNLFGQSIDYNLKKGYVAEGYDVVSYFENTAEEGKKEFSTTYDGVKFKFSSKAHLDKFLQNPGQYVPQYGGYCAYAVAIKSKKVGINPETFEIRDGKLYLFYNAWGNNTLKTWQETNVKGLQKKADQHWEAIKDF